MAQHHIRSVLTSCVVVTVVASLSCGTAPQGEKGEQGSAGSAGAPGSAGVAGPIGPAGAVGATGATGAVGATGATGATGAAGPQGDAGLPGPVRSPRLLVDRSCGWLPANRNALNNLLLARGIASSTYDSRNRPVAIFDWDNTMQKNDIGDGTFFYMLQHDLVLQPPGKDWGLTSRTLTVAAKTALNAACDALAAAGAPLPTSTNVACGNEIFSVYYNATTLAGAAAWAPEKTLTTNNAYAWAAQVLGGYTQVQARAIARAAFDHYSTMPLGSTDTFGASSVPGYVRIYPQMKDLVNALQENGFDVWVVTARVPPRVV